MFQLRIATESTRNVEICTKTRSSIETQNTQKKQIHFGNYNVKTQAPRLMVFSRLDIFFSILDTLIDKNNKKLFRTRPSKTSISRKKMSFKKRNFKFFFLKVNERRTSRLCTPLSPIKESRREGSGSSLELRCSPEPERSMTSSPVTPVDNAEVCIHWAKNGENFGI